MISVSRTLLPSLKAYNKYLEKIWKSNWLTNNGQLVQELEKKLADYWKVKNVVLVDHGTSAIMLALRALDIKKEIYVSPFNFVADVSAPLWMGIKPRFVDFDEKYGNPALVTHLYGLPEIVEAKPVIYDASHAFALKYKGKSIVSYGDVSVLSLHAVKTFQTIEGGALVTRNDAIAEKVRWMRNFGLKGRYDYYGVGINCKMDEFQAAMGLCALPLVKKIMKKYVKIIGRYNKAFGLDYQDVTYYPYLYPSEDKLLKALPLFEKHDIFPRRYFYPTMNTVFGGKKCPLAEEFSRRVLALPLYHDLPAKTQELIIKITKETA